jgi:hypothetical protein
MPSDQLAIEHRILDGRNALRIMDRLMLSFFGVFAVLVRLTVVGFMVEMCIGKWDWLHI